MNGFVKMLSLQVPERHVDGCHGGDRDTGPAEVHRVAIHFLPETFCFERVLPDQQLAESTGDVMAVGSINDGFDDFWRGVSFTDAFQSIICFYADQH